MLQQAVLPKQGVNVARIRDSFARYCPMVPLLFSHSVRYLSNTKSFYWSVLVMRLPRISLPLAAAVTANAHPHLSTIVRDVPRRLRVLSAPTRPPRRSAAPSAQPARAQAKAAPLSEAELRKRVMGLALPAIGEQLLTLGVGVSDTFLAGHLSQSAVAEIGYARRPLLVMLLVNGANIAGSWTLMNGFAPLGIHPIGVVGSAIGAATGWTIGMVMAVSLLSRAHPRAPRLRWAALRPDRDVALRILHVGLPSAAEIGVFQLGLVAFGRVVVGLGATAYAANVSINTVESLGVLPGFGFAVATTALVGQALGAADPELAVRVVWSALRPCVAMMGTIGLVALLLPQLLLGLFVADASVLSAGGIAMRLSCLTLPAAGGGFIFNSALRGSGDTKFPVVVRAART